MKIDTVMLKLTFLLLIQQFISIFKNTITRYLMKNYITVNELPIGKWYTWEFINALNFTKIGALLLIASFTAITFPLGMWLASFNMASSYPVRRMISAGMSLVTFPVNFYIMNQTLKEMPVNRSTLTGAGLIVVAQLIMILAGWIMYQGGKTVG